MPVDPASFKIRFPEFASEVDARIQLFIDDSVIILNESYWGEKYDMGVYYLTAHYLTSANKTAVGSTGSSNPVSGKSVEGVSISYAIPTTDSESDAFYASTAYGQRYLALRKTLGIPAYAI